MVITGPLTDWGAVWMSKRNGGIYEPEYRLVFMSTMLFGVFGYAGWAGKYSALHLHRYLADRARQWVQPTICHG